MSIPGDKHNPKIPRDYFAKFNDGLHQKLKDEDTFHQKDFPILFSLKKQDDFVVPGQYFGSFKAKNDPNSGKSSSKYRLVALAASILIAVSIFGLSLEKESAKKEEINTEEILRYFAEEDELFDSYDDDFNAIMTAENREIFTDIEEEILIDYLYENADPLDLAWLY